MTAHRHRWTAPDRPDVLECADCGAICTWDLTDRSTHPDARLDREAPPERKPVAGWVATEIGSLVLRRSDGVGSHAVVHGQVWRTATACGSAPTIESAQLAAEDALRAIAAEILRAVGP